MSKLMATQKQCELALHKYEDKLSANKNVVGLGIVKAADDTKSREVAVAVYVRRLTKGIKKGHGKERIPDKLTIDWEGRETDVPIRLIEQGDIELEKPSDSGLRG